MLKNPILPGFNPDPCICRKGDDYYMVEATRIELVSENKSTQLSTSVVYLH